MHRRTLLGSAAAALAAPRIVRAQTTRTLRFVPQADPAILDPVVTTGLVSRNHGFLIFDTLYGRRRAIPRQAANGRRAHHRPMTVCSGP